MLLASIETNFVRIARATEPETQDKRTRLSFRPALGPQQRTIDREFSAGLHFIGEWHTHPEPCPVPSQVDVCSMNDCFRLSKHQLAGLVMIIIGTERSMKGLWISIHTDDAYHRLVTSGPITPITPESSEG
ncbi:MAG: Mov34/MPN/PAD-1 family protein [Verrucomicrobiales bacterium]|nr:Mov34/MPN/PAD-1 family protein [Verrucomicrobiales bacterium]